MDHPGFWNKAGPFSVAELAAATGSEPAAGNIDNLSIKDIATLETAGPNDLTFFENVKYLDQFRETRAAACIVLRRFEAHAPAGVQLLFSDTPYQAFARALGQFYPDAFNSRAAGVDMTADKALVHPNAVIENNVEIQPGAIIGAEAHIGSGSTICAGAVIGYRVAVGRNCYIGAGTSLIHALIGNSVIIHPGVRIGQDGFGFAMSPAGHLKVPQIGRVIIQDDVEVGANTTIDRGSLSDTIIGEGTKIDNLVQIGHNVVTGRHCVIVAQTGISGSTKLGDFVVMGGQSAAVGHLTIGDGAQIAGGAKLAKSVPAGAKMGGVPAQPVTDWMKEVAMLKMLRRERAEKKRRKK